MRKILALLWLTLFVCVANAQSIGPVPSSGSGGITAGSTTITGCTALNLFYDNSGVMGCMGGTSWDNTNGALKLPAGTVAIPTINFGTTNTGIWAAAPGLLSFSVSGAEVLRMQAGTAFILSGAFTVSAGPIAASQSVRTTCVTVAGLGAAGTAGRNWCVTDQLTACPALGGTFTGGGAVVCKAFDDGTNWTHQ